VAFVVVSQCSGALVKRVGARAMIVGGMGLMGAGLLLLALVSSAPSMVLVEAALLLIGIRLGLNTGAVNAVAVASLLPARSGAASGLINTDARGRRHARHCDPGLRLCSSRRNPRNPRVRGLRPAYLGGALVELAGALLALVFITDHSMEQRKT
jgi:hypothetical protein